MQIIYTAAVLATLALTLPACTAEPGEPSAAGEEAAELSAAAIDLDDSDFTADTQVVRLPEETTSP